MAALVIIPFPLWHFKSFKSFSHLCSLCKGYTLLQSPCGLLSRTTSLVFIHTILLQWPPLFRCFFSSHKSKTSTAWWEISHFSVGLVRLNTPLPSVRHIWSTGLYFSTECGSALKSLARFQLLCMHLIRNRSGPCCCLCVYARAKAWIWCVSQGRD